MNIYVKINKLKPNSAIEDRSFSADAFNLTGQKSDYVYFKYSVNFNWFL